MPAPANMFDLLLDGSDDESGNSPQSKAPAAKKAPAPKTEEAKPARDRKPKNDRPARGGREERDNTAYDGSDKAGNPAERGDRKGAKGGKGRRHHEEGKGKGKGRNEGGRREFDRQSGTGKGRGETRGGAGKYNWGEKTETAAAVEENSDAAAEDAPKRERKEWAAPEEPEEEPEPEVMSAEDYFKSISDTSTIGGKLEERKVDESYEGEELTHDDDQDGAADQMYGMAFHDYDGKKKKRDNKEAREGFALADDILTIKHVDPNAGGGKGERSGKGKGDRKGGKGDRNDSRGGKGGRGAPRQQRQAANFSLEDTSAFPSLG